MIIMEGETMNSTLLLILITLGVVAIIAIVTVLNSIHSRRNKELKKIIDNLEIEKNKIDSTPITPELSKVEPLIKNDKLAVIYHNWQERLEDIKENQIPNLTDMLIETEYSLNKTNYKGTMYKIAKLEMEIYKVRTNSEILLNEIKGVTSSEERNRKTITELKSKYRELYRTFTSNSSEYGEVARYISLQFETIAKSFELFERAIEKKEVLEINEIIKSIENMLKNMDVTIEEVPSILLMAKNIIPKRIEEATTTYKEMTKQGYPLDYLNVEYNLDEANKKLADILDRTRVLNLEDNLFELKILLDYFDTLFNDFEKEKIEKENFEELDYKFQTKLQKINKLVTEIFNQFDKIKNVYNLSEEDINALQEIKKELKSLHKDHQMVVSNSKSGSISYSKMIKEVEKLFSHLVTVEDSLDSSLDVIGSMRDDEIRARQQLEEIKSILKDSKKAMKESNIPLIPKTYYTELKEASAAVKEIVNELEKKPITIKTLNIRVDTARDLVLKLYTKTQDILKNAKFAEMAIVYGNRYRGEVEGVDKNLTYCEVLFFKGDYKKSLDISINILNRIEPGIYDKLLKLYGE